MKLQVGDGDDDDDDDDGTTTMTEANILLFSVASGEHADISKKTCFHMFHTTPKQNK